jgi:protein phosphatase
MTVAFEFASGEIQGGRSQQEDHHRVSIIDSVKQNDTPAQLAILADGMGGHTAGARASRTAVTAFEVGFLSSSGDIQQRLTTALNQANQSLALEMKTNHSLLGMGCTLVCAYVTRTRLSWISVGDSHLYLYRQGRTRKLNEDHSLAGHLRRHPPNEAIGDLCLGDFPSPHTLLSALTGQQPLDLVDLSRTPMVLDDEDIILLASDGLNTLTRDELTDLLHAHAQTFPPCSLDTLVKALISAVEDKNVPQQDNVTLIALRQPFLDRELKT